MHATAAHLKALEKVAELSRQLKEARQTIKAQDALIAQARDALNPFALDAAISPVLHALNRHLSR